jgi:hypothetical protein
MVSISKEAENLTELQKLSPLKDLLWDLELTQTLRL